MRTRWHVIVVVLLALCAGATALVAQEAARAQKQVDIRTLVPEDAVFYVEVGDLAGTWEAVKAGPLYAEILQTQAGKQLQMFAAALQNQFEMNLGVTFEELILQNLGTRVVMAAWPQDGGTVGALLTQVDDPTNTGELLADIRQSEIDEGKVARHDEIHHKGQTIYVKVPPHQGKKEYTALCGNVAMVSDSLPAVERLIDRFVASPGSSIVDSTSFKAARAALPAGYQVFAFADFEKALAGAPLDEAGVAAGKPPVARYLIRHLVSVARSLRQGAGGLYVTSAGVEIRLTVTRDPSLLTEEMRGVFSQENATPTALSYLSEHALFFVSFPRISAQMQMLGDALDTLRPRVGDLAEGVTAAEPLDLILGRSFTQGVLPALGPEVSLLLEAFPVRRAGAGGSPVTVHPVVTLFVQMSDDLRPEVERLVKSVLGFALTANRGKAQLFEVNRDNVTGYVVKLLHGPPFKRETLQPTVAFTDGFLVLASHPRGLQHGLSAERRTVVPGPDNSGHIVVGAELGRALRTLEVLKPLIVQQQVAKGKKSEADALRDIDSGIELLRPLAGRATLTVKHEPAETNVHFTLKTRTPVLR